VEAADLATSIGYTVVGRLAGGEGEGAYEVLTADGTPAMLKDSGGGQLDFERAARTTDALRSRGYPAPATLATGSVDGAIDDVVHMDFHTASMLAIDRRITGVIDWEGSTSGDAAFDLVTQALYAPDLRTELLDAARARTDPHALPLYAAHMVLRQVDWSLRHHNAAQVRRYLDEGVALLAATASG
jgi:Phosphotransferase enzyme family